MSTLPENPLFKITDEMLTRSGLTQSEAKSLGARYTDEFYLLAAKKYPHSHTHMNVQNKKKLQEIYQRRRKKEKKNDREGNPRFIVCSHCKSMKTCYTKGEQCKDCFEEEQQKKNEALRKRLVHENNLHPSSPWFDHIGYSAFKPK